MFTPRDYQCDAIESGVNFFQSGTSKDSISVIPTGGGKSLVVGSIANELDGNVLVLQPSKEILEQNYNKTKEFGAHDIGIYSASFDSRQRAKVTFSTIGSIYKRPDLFESFKYCIMDECHGIKPKGGMYQSFFGATDMRVLGLTATPYRLHSGGSGGNASIKFLNRTKPRFFDDIIHITQNGELFDRGYLCPIEYFEETHSEENLKLNSSGSDFTESSIKQFYEEASINDKIVYHCLHQEANHILAFTSFKSDAYYVQEKLEKIGITAAVVHGELHGTLRDKILRQFIAGEIKVVINVGVLTTGFDFPALDCVIMGRLTNSLSLFYQILGRLIRIHEGKLLGRYIDLCGNVKRFGRVEDFEIVEPKPNMHRLKCGDKYLTGIDLLTGEDIEARKPASFTQYRQVKGTKITFGKYRGQDVKTVPIHYLKFVRDNFAEGDPNREFCMDEINRRRTLGMRID